MKKPTHLLSGLLLTETYIVWLGVPLELAYLVHPLVTSVVCMTAGVCLAGSVFPDIDLKIPFLGHRTLTHWPIPYLLGAFVFWHYAMAYPFLFCLAVLVHIFLDSFTKMGVPVVKPFGRRYGIRRVTTGSIAELFFVFALCAAGWWLL